MEEYRAMKETILRAVQENVKGTKEEVEKAVEAVTDAVMDAIAENYRSITEIHSIVAAVRAGMRVQIAYADPEDPDFMDPYTVRACW
jgi:N-acetylglucosamine kinase-like BadF-type ATPase